MDLEAIVAPELIRPVTDPIKIIQDFVQSQGINEPATPQEVTEPALALIPPISNWKQEEAIKYALTGTYTEQVWGDVLPAIRKEFPGIDEILRGMKQGNFSRLTVEKAVTQALQGKDVEHNPTALALHRIFAAWQLRHEVVEQHRPLRLWPPPFPDPDYDAAPLSFTPMLQYVGKRFWKLGYEGDTYPDSPRLFHGRTWDKILAEVFLTYHTWYRLDQERKFKRQFTLDPTKRHIYDPIWTHTLMNTGQLTFGRVQLSTPLTSPVFKVIIDDVPFKINAFNLYPPDVIRAAIEYSGDQPPPPADPIACYLKMMAWGAEPGQLHQEGNLYRVTFPTVPVLLKAYAMAIKVQWLDDTRATVTGDQLPWEATLITGDRIRMISEAGVIGWVNWPNLELTDEARRRLISLWAMWTWQWANAGQIFLKDQGQVFKKGSWLDQSPLSKLFKFR